MLGPPQRRASTGSRGRRPRSRLENSVERSDPSKIRFLQVESLGDIHYQSCLDQVLNNYCYAQLLLHYAQLLLHNEKMVRNLNMDTQILPIMEKIDAQLLLHTRGAQGEVCGEVQGVQRELNAFDCTRAGRNPKMKN
jgi:hypothetical protein